MAWNPTDKLNKIVVSAQNMEDTINTPHTLDCALMCGKGDVIEYTPTLEPNTNEATGYEDPTRLDYMGAAVKATLNFEKLRAIDLAFMGAYGLGEVAVASAGSGKVFTLTRRTTPVDVNRDLPTLTAAMRIGSGFKLLCAGMGISQFSFNIKAGSDKLEYVTGKCDLIGTGHATENMATETISALPTTTELTLISGSVHGTTASERRANVHKVLVELTSGVWTVVTVNAVSDADPAVITIEPPGAGVSNVNYRVIYRLKEVAASWQDKLETLTPVAEPPLKIVGVSMTVGGKWDGSAMQGGVPLGCPVTSVDCGINNNQKPRYCINSLGAEYAGSMERGDWAHTLSFEQRFYDYLMQDFLNWQRSDAKYFSLYIKLDTGIEFDTGHTYSAEIVYPNIGFKQISFGKDGTKATQKMELVPLDGQYGSVIVKVKTDTFTTLAA